ncbi:hypothetical protein J2Z44_004018 [Clostridium punense]|uniref:Uncharacterized protein n=1 Tax=Clostridium punense TaxID=1054297 RepID=A0ABS4K8Q2_9CLOT|nr:MULTISPECIES: hypothetical protein [Clostridium]EQB90000.1 hypothetical protein M918_02335 [Clostridium sp. BL8]MBP2024163.1 hypothetical protein [Clostridium punense]
MKYFQLIAFVLEIVFLIPFILWGVLSSTNIIKEERNWLNSGKPYKVVIEILSRCVMFLFFMYLAYSSLAPRVMDIPNLVTGNLSTVEGYAIKIERRSKDLYEQIDINGTRARFFLGSGVEGWQEYKVGYLPKSHRAIIIERKSQGPSSAGKKVGLPWKPILVVLYVVGVILLLNRFAFWFLSIGSAVYFPLHAYFYYSYGKFHGVWGLKGNDALVNLIGGLVFLLMLGMFYFMERWMKKRRIRGYIQKYGDSEDYYITKLTAHFIVFIYILATLKYLNML